MDETVNQEQVTTGQPEVKTFTQEELNSIVEERLNRERKKYEGFEDYKAKAEQLDQIEEANKSELQKATEKAEKLEAELTSLKNAESLRKIKEKVATETGVPAGLLTAETEEACTEQANAILAFAQPKTGYPNLKDSGEVTTPTMTKEEILAIKDERKRLKAIESNINLFK